MRKLICIIDDDAHMLKFLGRTLSGSGTDVQLYQSPTEFFAAVAVGVPDVVVLDLLMPEMSGIEVLRHIRNSHPMLPVVMLTTEAKIETAVRAMKEGVFDYITKPVDVEEFRLRVQRALEIGQLREKVTGDLERLKSSKSVDAIAGVSKIAKRNRELALRAITAPERALWLIGEQGTGKHFLAGVVHYGGSTAENGLYSRKCSQMDDGEAEQLLFGSVQRLEHGKTVRQRGLFEEADGGTLVLENPEFLDAAVLKKIAHYMETGDISPAGSKEKVPLKTRLICISEAREAQALIAEFQVDKDFVQAMEDRIYFLAPLSKRVEDLNELAKYYLEQCSRRDSIVYILQDDAVEKLCSYNWPGNITELHNALDRAILLSENGEISAREISLGNFTWTATEQGAVFSIPQGLTIKDLQGEYVRQTLEFYQGNLESTAASLGISRKTLWEIRKKFHLP